MGWTQACSRCGFGETSPHTHANPLRHAITVDYAVLNAREENSAHLLAGYVHRQPVQALVQTITVGGTCALDVPAAQKGS